MSSCTPLWPGNGQDDTRLLSDILLSGARAAAFTSGPVLVGATRPPVNQQFAMENGPFLSIYNFSPMNHENILKS